MYSALDIAMYVVNKCTIDDCAISNLHLQKILYYLQREYLQRGMNGLFEDDICAWKFGPVVEAVYFFFCSNGASPIRRRYDVHIEAEDILIIDSIVEHYRSISPWDLVEETHKPGKAWAEVFNGGIGIYNVIPRELIMQIG